MDPDVSHDWFGNPLHADGGRLTDPVTCPRCPATFRRSAEFAAHLAEAHAMAPRRRRRPRAYGERWRRWTRSLRFLSPWVVLPMNAAVTFALYRAWGAGAALWAAGGPDGLLRAWAWRLSVLPAVLLLASRAVDGHE